MGSLNYFSKKLLLSRTKHKFQIREIPISRTGIVPNS